jgi:hypothetical protein
MGRKPRGLTLFKRPWPKWPAPGSSFAGAPREQGNINERLTNSTARRAFAARGSLRVWEIGDGWFS